MKLRGLQQSDLTWDILLLDETRVLASSATEDVTVKDSIYVEHTPAEYAQDKHIVVSDQTGMAPVQYVSLDETIVTVNEHGHCVVLQADKPARVNVTCAGSTRQVGWRSTVPNTAAVRVFKEFAVGSLARHISTTIDGYIAAKQPSETIGLFTNIVSNPTERNSSFWLSSLVPKFTCLSSRNDIEGVTYGQWTRGGVAITRRHLAYAHHFSTPNGTVFHFVTEDGTLHSRTQIGYAESAGDRGLVTLDSDLPLTINIAKLFPTNYLSYLPNKDIYNREQNPFPILVVNQEKYVSVSDIRGLALHKSTIHTYPTAVARQALWNGLRAGDSGHPGFFVINGELVLALTHLSAETGPTWLADTALTALIAAADANAGVSTGYTPSVIDLSSFTTH